MITLKTKEGGRFELPQSAIRIVEEQPEGTIIVYDMGEGQLSHEALLDQYGYVKKQVLDASGIDNPFETRVVDNTEDGAHRITFNRAAIIGRKELHEDPNGAKTVLFVNFGAGVTRIFSADTMNEMDGIEEAKPAKKGGKTNG